MYAGGAVAAVARALDGLEVDVDAMRRNLELTHGAVFGERITFLLAERMGRREARELVSRGELEHADLPDDAFDVNAAVATADAVVEQALERYGAVK
jgi:adenylosuccinate lyase